MKRIIPFLFCFFLCAIACEKTPEEIAVTSVSLNQPTADMIIGETVQLKVSISPSNATDKSVIWGSSKQSVATVSDSGFVSAISEGSSTITAAVGGKSASCQVIVSKGTVIVSSITLNKTNLEMVEGDSETLTATVKPDDATDKTVAWSTSNAQIVTVDAAGKVTAIKEGFTSITAKAGDKTALCTILVKQKQISVESVEFNRSSVEIVEGDTFKLVATVKPDDATDKTVAWSSSNNEVATVDETGKVAAIMAGEATITAKAGEKTASCFIIVKEKVPEAVDMGLSVKWASWNLGATKPEGCGDYYAWGEIDTQEEYSWNTYKWCIVNQYERTITKYNSSDDTRLSPDDDAAFVKYGNKWRIPTKNEWEELLDNNNCTKEWCSQGDIYGLKITSRINGVSIFLPARGYIYDSNYFFGSQGYYWSSSTNGDPRYPDVAWRLRFGKDSFAIGLDTRCAGFLIRPVMEDSTE